MKSIFLRLIVGLVGAFAALIAIFGLVFFIANERQEARSAHQYGGHASALGAAGGWAVVSLLTLFFVSVAYFSLRFALRGKNQRVV